MCKKLIMTAKDIEDKNKWLELRKQYIGGSEAGSIIGVNPFKSAFALWLEKTGQAEEPDLSDNLKVWFGTELENAVARKFCKDTNKKVQRTGVYTNSKYPWACASIDRMVVGENVPLECKTTGSYSKKQWEGENIPDSYYCQILHYMTVLEVDYCYIACMFGNGDDFVIKKVDFNKADSEALMKAEKEFFDKYIVGEDIPTVDGSENCSKVLKNRYKGGEVDEEFLLPNDAETIVQRYAELKAQEKIVKEETTLLGNQLKEMLKDNEIGKTDSYIVTWKVQKAKDKFNKDQLEKDLPDIYKQYCTQGETNRVLRYSKIRADKE